MDVKNEKQIFAEKLRANFAEFGIIPAGTALLNPEIPDKFYILYRELTEWNRKINITAVSGIEDFIKKHVLDSAFLLKILGKNTRSLTDIGSGAGFPGIVAALLNPSLSVVSVESVLKKCNFQKNAARKLGLENFKCLNCNIFSCGGINGKAAAVTTRAAFNTGELINLIEKLDFGGGFTLYPFMSGLEEAMSVGAFNYKSKRVELDRILFYKTDYSDNKNRSGASRIIAKFRVGPVKR